MSGLIVAAAIAIAPPPTADDAHAYRAYVDCVIDGDTLVADIELGWGLWLQDQHIRIKNCWAPELKEVGGDESRKSLTGLLDSEPKTAAFDPGAEVLLRSGTAARLGEREKYGRILGEVFRDGVSVGAEQVRRKHATTQPLPKATAATSASSVTPPRSR